MKFYYSILVFLLVAPVVLFAQASGNVVYGDPLVDLPGYEPEGGIALSGLVNLTYGLAISLAAMLAVIKIVIAGVKWMISDVVTDKSEAKKDIQNALFGLIIIISAVLIITIINPDIVGAPTSGEETPPADPVE